jgi:hypothetical protein
MVYAVYKNARLITSLSEKYEKSRTGSFKNYLRIGQSYQSKGIV